MFQIGSSSIYSSDASTSRQLGISSRSTSITIYLFASSLVRPMLSSATKRARSMYSTSGLFGESMIDLPEVQRYSGSFLIVYYLLNYSEKIGSLQPIHSTSAFEPQGCPSAEPSSAQIIILVRLEFLKALDEIIQPLASILSTVKLGVF